MILSILIPCYNEEKTVEELIKRVRSVKIDNIEFEIIAIDDCSTDTTLQILNRLKSEYPELKVKSQERNQGKGSALKAGIILASGDFVIFQDADLEYNPQNYHSLLKPLTDGSADIVYGSRFHDKSSYKGASFLHIAANLFLTRFSNLLNGLRISDMETCYKVFRADIVKKIEIEERGFSVEPEITAKVAALIRGGQATITEVPIDYNPRSYGQGKKIGFSDGIKALYCIIKYRLK